MLMYTEEREDYLRENKRKVKKYIEREKKGENRLETGRASFKKL